jgi:TolB-like protein/Flp pilus assembly protein TadD
VEKPFSAYRGDGPYVFVCYAHEDSEAVFREIAWLNDYGVNVWYDEGISPGHEWREELAAAIQGCSRMLFFVSPRSVVSEHCRRELNFAQEENREVIAIHLEPTEMPAGLRLGLNNRQAILKRELSEEEFHKRLMRAAQGGSDTAVASAPGPRVSAARVRAGVVVAVVVLIVSAAGTWWFRSEEGHSIGIDPAPAAGDKPPPNQEVLRNSIAVLPFVNMSRDPDQEYFSDGISEDLLNRLAKNPNLKVISRSSSFTFKGGNMDIPTVAERLGVTHVLEGSVRKAGNTVRVTAQLIDAQTDTHLWSDTYDRELDDVFAIQDEIASQVAEALNLALFGVSGAQRPVNLNAYTLYLQGRHLTQTGTPENLESAETMLKEALTLDPNYSEAWIALAQVYVSKSFASIMPMAEFQRLYSEAIDRARTLDPENPHVYASLASHSMFVDRDLASAAEYIEKGISLGPTNLAVINEAAALALNLGRLDEAEALAEYITAHDPLCANCFNNLGSIYLLEEKLDQASSALETVELLGGGLADNNLVAALVLLLQGKPEDSLARWRRALPGPFRTYGEAITLYSLGREDEFAAKFGELKGQYGEDYPTMVARVYAWMGDADSAFEWLDRYQVEHPELGPVIGNFWELLSVELKGLHDDPRWQSHLRKLGIAPEQLAAFEFDIPLPE